MFTLTQCTASCTLLRPILLTHTASSSAGRPALLQKRHARIGKAVVRLQPERLRDVPVLFKDLQPKVVPPVTEHAEIRTPCSPDSRSSPPSRCRPASPGSHPESTSFPECCARRRFSLTRACRSRCRGQHRRGACLRSHFSGASPETLPGPRSSPSSTRCAAEPSAPTA